MEERKEEEEGRGENEKGWRALPWDKRRRKRRSDSTSSVLRTACERRESLLFLGQV